MHRIIPALVAMLLVSACASSAAAPVGSASVPPATPASPTSAASARADATPPPMVPPRGTTWFGMNLDWSTTTIPDVTDALGVTPAVWVQFVPMPLDDAARANLDGFFEQVAAAGARALVTLEPHAGLSAVTAEAADEVAAILDAAWRERGVATFVRFAHEMNGSWYAWGQQPDAYRDAFRTVAEALRRASPTSATVWAPNEGAGYPFIGGPHGATAGSADAAALDTDGDGTLTAADDPYAPYWPGDDVVDWVGMSLYFWGLEHPWGENELAPAGRFAAQLTGAPTGAHATDVAVPDFYATWAEGHDKPMAIIETAALFDPARGGPAEADVKGAWFRQVFGADTREAFPRIGMINWFEWRKDEPEVGTTIDWRLAADPDLARSLLGSVPDGWLRFAGE